MSVTQKINQETLKEIGRLQYFYHCKSSLLPIRDVLNTQKMGYKTEPHIEIGAENYCYPCYQSNNIKPFAERNEKYLFLFTNCMNKNIPKLYNKQCIVGYIKKEFVGLSPFQLKSSCNPSDRKSHIFVKGETFIYDFKDALPLTAIGIIDKRILKKNADDKITQIILNHFKGKNNIIEDCIDEIISLDKDNKTCLRVSAKKNCLYKDECSRW